MMKVLFLGTGEIAIPTFRALVESGHEVVGLVTQPDKVSDRSGVPSPPAMKVVAMEAGIPVFQPERIRDRSILAELEELQADLMVVMAYGQILPRRLLAMPKLAIINLHASLLPKYRGASCLQAAILNGDCETGWSVMHVVSALDAGDVIHVLKADLLPDETGESLHDRMAGLGPQALMEAMALLEAGTAPRKPQVESESCYAPKLEREDGRIDWSRTAEEIALRVRALHSWPGSYAEFVDGRGKIKRLKFYPPVVVRPDSGQPGEVLRSEADGLLVACGVGSVAFAALQAEGARKLSGEEFLRGTALVQIL